MDGNNGETVDMSQLALEFLQGTRPTTSVEETSETEESDTPEVEEVTTHPAWKSILDAVPAEYHDALKPTLQEWDTGVSKRFQKLHDEYEPLKRFENYEPDTVEELVDETVVQVSAGNSYSMALTENGDVYTDWR